MALPTALKSKYPIDGLLDGWFFRYERLESGMYRVEGIDELGRSVSRICPEQKIDATLRLCAKDALQIERQ